MLRFTMTVQGVPVIDAALVGLKVAYADLRPVWPEVSAFMEQTMSQRFTSDGDGTWAPLKSEAYARWKARNYPSAKGVLRRSYRLHASLTDEANALGGDAVRGMDDPHRFTFGTLVPYAGYHHSGEGVPARRILVFSEDHQRKLMKIIHRFIADALSGARMGMSTGVGRAE